MNELHHEFTDNTPTGSKVVVYVFRGQECLQSEPDGQLPVMLRGELGSAGLRDVVFLGRIDGVSCYAAKPGDDFCQMSGYEYKDIRLITPYADTYLWQAGYALHILNWNASHIYCSACGGKLHDSTYERAKICDDCGVVIYPQISPAIIVRITSGDKILLARNKAFPEGLYALISGFLEPGESIEHCVEREVSEEIGIRVKNIKYFGSQPWPFSGAVMLGYTAEYDSGEIVADGEEIVDARWFTADELPVIPGYGSIARALIDSYVGRN